MRTSRVAALLILCYAIGDSHPVECPDDSVREENGECKCAAVCPPVECPTGERPVQLKPADPDTAGSCCVRYDCLPISSEPRGSEPCPENSVLTEDGKCECAPCPPASCHPGYRPVQVRAALDPETPGSCCPLYECRPAESVLLVKETAEVAKSGKYCIYEGKGRKLGERWRQSDCVNCVCQENGAVSCQEPMCKPCENAIPPSPGECCPHCPPLPNATLLEPESPCPPAFDHCELICEHDYDKDEDNCPICSCANPVEKEKDEEEEQLVEATCPEPVNCEQPDCKLAKDGNGCSVCVCPSSDVSRQSVNETAGKKICPEVKCDLHCERGLVMDENDCTFCECKPSDSSCPPLIGCRKRCDVGYKTSKRGCPICRCRASCTDRFNGTYPEGASWHPNSCTSCTCEPGGKLSCRETVCSVGCNDPLPPNPGTCCPVCPPAKGSSGPTGQQQQGRGKGWGTVPITLIAILVLLCLVLIVHIVRGRFRARLSPSEASYYPYSSSQYYKCVPAYDTPVHLHRNEKIVPL